MSSGFTGSCLCGAVKIECAVDPMLTGHCHCVDCRKSSGSGHCTHLVVPEGAFTVSGVVKFFNNAADSGNIVSRGFCPTCGSPIYSTNAAMPGMVFPRASCLDDPDIAKPEMAIYASRAPSWDYIDPALPSVEEMPEGGPQQVMEERAKG